MKRNIRYRAFNILLIVVFLCGILMKEITVKADVIEDNDIGIVNNEDLLSIVHDTISYEEYLESHQNYSYPTEETVIHGGDFISASGTYERKDRYMDSSGSVVLTGEESSVIYQVNVPRTGFYNIAIEYYPTPGKGNTIERELYINGEIPFDGASYLNFYRSWENATEVYRDTRDNDVRPKQQEIPKWKKQYVKDSDGYYKESYKFYFEEGMNEISLVSIKESMAIGRIFLTQEDEVPSYEDYIHINSSNGAKKVNGVIDIKVQAEDALIKSNSTIYPINDRTSPMTQPYHPSKIRLNTIGGNNWKILGQWITWEIDVEEDGFYEIALKYRQNIKSGVTVTRGLRIDGILPFKEADELEFSYKNDWQISKLGNEEDSYLFYLTKGTHTFTLEANLSSEMADILRLAEESIFELNRAYRQLLMVIGNSPDGLRDYQLEKKTPEALRILNEQYQVVEGISKRLDSYTKGSKGSDSAAIDNLLIQLKIMYTKPETIAKQWAAFKNNIISLGSWTLSMKEQPLELDYILIQEPDAKLPKIKASFFARLIHNLKAFFASFVEDYDSIGEVYEGEALTVWLLAEESALAATMKGTGGGRDQATILKELVDNYFITEYKIPVNVKLVNSGVLLSATLAGEGPDIALNVGGKEPVNYALRNAAVDLTQFSDFEQIKEWFHYDSMEQFSFDGGVYALPQTMSFHVMFYRADILKELGLPVPSTMDEFYECLSVIQKNNMNVGISPDYTTYAMYLYQHGGMYYKKDGTASGLDSEAAVQAFTRWCSNYANYKMPVVFDFVNRFRTGEMPIGITDYTNYSFLSVFAPEIRGLWGFTTVPGYVDEDGNIDKSVSSWQSASLILNTSDKKDDAWTFLKWWMSAETQTSYGNSIENILGISGRIATANIEALKNLPWSSRDFRQLSNQLEWVKVIPEVPGGYFTERHVRNGFYTVYNNNEDPRETLEEVVKLINNEIANKRKEFGLD